jgi:hypothetical protein
MGEHLSEWLSVQSGLFDTREGNTLSADDRKARFYLERIAEELIEGRETFTDERWDILEQALRNEPGIVEEEIDRLLTTRALSGIRGMVDRLVDLSKLERVKIPSNQTANYVSHATRSYMYRLYQASAAMSRVALEQALKEALGRQGIEDFKPFQVLRREAEKKGILDGVTGPATCKIAKDASKVIHHGPTDAKGALAILDGSRGLIVQIYKAGNSQAARRKGL